MPPKSLKIMTLAFGLTAFFTVSVRAETLELNIEAKYQNNKQQCMAKYGPKCSWWWGCSGGYGDTPTAITQTAIKKSREVLSVLVEENIEPWWTAWWGWTPPDNTSKYETISTYAHMHGLCNGIESDSPIPGLQSIESYTELSANTQSILSKGIGISLFKKIKNN